MKTERYIVEIEMPDGDMASSIWVCDTLQNESDIEDEGRWKISVKEYWKPSDEQMVALKHAFNDGSIAFADMKILATLYEQLKASHRYEQDT